MSGILPAAPDGDALARKKMRMQQAYAQQLEQQMLERKANKDREKGQTRDTRGHTTIVVQSAVLSDSAGRSATQRAATVLTVV
jgi:hypothetical protein